jgi:hypothetical protein
MVSIAPPAHDEVRASRKTMQELPIHHTLPAKKATWRALLGRGGSIILYGNAVFRSKRFFDPADPQAPPL